MGAMNEKTTDAMLDPAWTRERGYSHADALLSIIARLNAEGGDIMATSKTTRAATKQKLEEAVKATPEAASIRPEDLAKELGISGKLIRAWLRKTYPRAADQKRSSWFLTQKQADAVRAHWAPKEDEDDE